MIGTVTATEGQLFATEDSVRLGLNRDFLAAELMGLPIVDEVDCFVVLDTMAIAAEDLAQTIARLRGDVNPEAEAFMQELIIGDINQDDSPPALTFDIDREFRDKDVVDETIIGQLAGRAYQIAVVLVDREFHTATVSN